MEAPRIPDKLVFRVHLRTRWSDEDTQGVLNNAVYLTLLEESRHRYFLDVELLDNNRFPFVLFQTNARFLAPLRGGAEVEVAVSTTHIGTSSFQQAYRITDSATGQVACEAEAVLVGWSNERGAKQPLSEDFKDTLRGFEGLA